MQKQAVRRLRTCDKSLVALMVLLLVFGLITLFSATYYPKTAAGDPLSAVKKQLIGVGLGAAACVTLSRVPYRVFRGRRVMLALLALSALLLVLVIIPGVGVSINGSRRWLNVLGLSMQPSEFAKYAMVIFMAGMLDRRGDEIGSLFRGVIPLLIVPGVMFLLILEQPNLSTGGSILICALAMLFCAGLRFRHMALLGTCGAAVFAFYAWSAPYRRERLLSFRDPFAKMSDEGYQLSQSLICLPAVPGVRFYLRHCRRGFRPGGLHAGDCAVRAVCVCGTARIPALPGSIRLPAWRGHYLDDWPAGVYQHGRGHGHAAHYGAAPAVFQRRRHVGKHDYGGGRHFAEYIAHERTASGGQ